MNVLSGALLKHGASAASLLLPQIAAGTQRAGLQAGRQADSNAGPIQAGVSDAAARKTTARGTGREGQCLLLAVGTAALLAAAHLFRTAALHLRASAATALTVLGW